MLRVTAATIFKPEHKANTVKCKSSILLLVLACDVYGRIILRWIFRKLEGVVGTGWSWLRIGTGGGYLWVR